MNTENRQERTNTIGEGSSKFSVLMNMSDQKSMTVGFGFLTLNNNNNNKLIVQMISNNEQRHQN